MPSFPAQLALSALVMGGVVTGLFFIGQNSRDGGGIGAAPGSGSGLPSSTAPGEASATAPGLDPRSLLPARSWLVADFEGRLMGGSPFAQGDARCQSVPPPERVGVALVGATAAGGDAGRPGDDAGAALVLISPAVSAEFWRCVRLEVERAGGQILGTSPDEETLASPSGVLVHRAGRLLFASDRAHLDELRELARGSSQNAASSPPHSQLRDRIGAIRTLGASKPGASQQSASKQSAEPSSLLLTLSLPPDWLAEVGPEAAESPLRHLVAGAVRADADGGALGELECAEPGCEDLVAFLLRARADLGASLPPPLGEATVQAWTASRQTLSPTRGLIRLRWVPGKVSFADWVSGLWKTLSSRGAEIPAAPAP